MRSELRREQFGQPLVQQVPELPSPDSRATPDVPLPPLCPGTEELRAPRQAPFPTLAPDAPDAASDPVDLQPLVSVVIPAYNAAATLDETLESARAQTYPALEIIVVDDGSTDETRRIALMHAARDPRVRVLSRRNGGVARARNAGIAAARAALIAPLDADDLWHPQKIARQVEAMQKGGPEVGYVYTACRRLDGAGRTRGRFHFHRCEGRVFLRSLIANFVGNGSSLLIRREALEEVGGYSTELQALGLPGTEDWLVQILIARHWKVAAVPAALTGYRRSAGSMSANAERMLRSQLKAVELVLSRHPETPSRVALSAVALLEVRLALRLARDGRLAEAARVLAGATRRCRRSAAIVAAAKAWQLACGPRLRTLLGKSVHPGWRFDCFDPDEWARKQKLSPLAGELRRLERFEDSLPARKQANGGSS